MAAPVEDAFMPNCPDWESLPDLNEIQADGFSVDNKIVQIEQFFPCLHHKLTCYNDDSTCTSAPSLIEFIDDDSSVDSLSSAGNATYLSSLENYQTEVEQPHYNYHGPEIVLPPNESPVTICTTDTINMVKSQHFLRVLLDSGSTVSLIKRTALPPNVVTKTISTTRHVTTLAGMIQAQEVVTLRDLRLPEFDKNRRIGEQKCLVFDNDTVK